MSCGIEGLRLATENKGGGSRRVRGWVQLGGRVWWVSIMEFGLTITSLGRLEMIVVLFFWTDKWIGDVPLSVRFSHLFNLAENPLCSVAYRCII
jgi:hypothetical protein